MIIYRKMRHGIWILFLIEVPILFTGWYLANMNIKKHRKSIQKQSFVHISSANPRQRIQAGKNREEIYDSKFEGLDFKDLLTKIKNSNGRNLHVCISSDEKTRKPQVTLKYSALVFPQMIDISKAKKQSLSKKYIFVHSQYTDQLSKNTLAFLSLCAQAGKSGRKVVMPYVKQTKFSSVKSWSPLETYYDVKYLKRLLAAAGYASLVASAEYEKECPRDSPNHVSIHFIDHSQASMGFTKANFRLKDDFYRAVVKNTTKNGWTKCEFLDRTMKRAPGKQFCVNGDIIKDWKVLEKNIFKNEKCLNIFLWRGIDGLRYRLKFSEHNYQFSSISLTFALRPGQVVINEVERFKKELGDKYIAVYVRSEKIRRKNSMRMEYLRQCVDLALEVLTALKIATGLSHVYVATDMGDYGSSSLVHYRKVKNLGENALKNIHDYIIAKSQGVAYSPPPHVVDRGVISLVDMNLVAHAQYLISAGKGTFQKWMAAKFLEIHRDDDKRLWSKITVCTQA